jgi:adenosine deaminase
VPVTINTDDPSVSDTTLTDEYLVAVETMGFTPKDIQQTIINAARAAFLPSDERRTLIERFEKHFGLT